MKKALREMQEEEIGMPVPQKSFIQHIKEKTVIAISFLGGWAIVHYFGLVGLALMILFGYGLFKLVKRIRG